MNGTIDTTKENAIYLTRVKFEWIKKKVRAVRIFPAEITIDKRCEFCNAYSCKDCPLGIYMKKYHTRHSDPDAFRWADCITHGPLATLNFTCGWTFTKIYTIVRMDNSLQQFHSENLLSSFLKDLHYIKYGG